MPSPRHTDQQIRAGTWTSAGMGSNYAITALARQSDMGIVEWIGPDPDISTPVNYARDSVNMDNSLTADGDIEFDLGFSYFTFGMHGLWLSSFLPAGVRSAPVTVMHYDDDENQLYIQCTIYKPRLPGDGDYAVGGWRHIKWKFRGGILTT